MNNTGKLITIEGSDGVGKTTQISLLIKYLAEAEKAEVVVLREPGSTVIGEEIRNLFKDRIKGAGMCPETELFLIQASRAQLVREKIKPALAAGKIVVCDRFIHSTMFYQGFGRGVDQSILNATTLFATDGVTPNLTILLTLPFEVALARKQTHTTDRMEVDEAFFKAVYEGIEWFKDAAKDAPKVLIVDGNRPIEEVQKDIADGVNLRLFTDLPKVPITKIVVPEKHKLILPGEVSVSKGKKIII